MIRRFGHAHLRQILLAFRLVEQADQLDRRFVVNGHHHVGVLDVVNPRHVLVADAFDAVRAEAVVQQRRALQRFAGAEFAVREDFLQVVAGPDRARRARREHGAAQRFAGFQRLLQALLPARDR